MSRKKKDYVPKDMEDLETIFYGPNKDGRNVDLYLQKRYLDWLRSQVLSQAFEDSVKKMFSPLGETEKIPESQKRPNFDYKIDDRKLLIEVTSLNIDETSPGDLTRRHLTRDEVLKKLKTAIDHVMDKDGSPFPGYRKGGAIVYTLPFNLFSELNKLLDEELPEMNEMFGNDLDFLIFFPQPASIENRSSWEVFPPVFYVKDRSLAEEFKKAFQGKNYKIKILH